MCHLYIFAPHPQSTCLYTILLGLSKSTTHTKKPACNYYRSVFYIYPFGVREVLQENRPPLWKNTPRLNPFEVREVLQDSSSSKHRYQCVSIPLKSGRCCKPFAILVWRRAVVSIPLKSGRCCKRWYYRETRYIRSQSLWSQGGAARHCRVGVV